MGYTINIGNAKPVFNTAYGELYAAWEVEGAESDLAPVFKGCPTGNANIRSPCYIVWHNFIEWANLNDLFYNKDDGLMRHTVEGACGINLISMPDWQLIKKSLDIKQASTIFPPGFCRVEEHNSIPVNPMASYAQCDCKVDANLARLIWLEFWFKWALANCETPAIEYS